MLYTFKCPVCQENYDLLLSMGDNLLEQPCPHASARDYDAPVMMKRVFDPIPHRFTFRAGWNDSVDQNFENEREYNTYLDKNELVKD